MVIFNGTAKIRIIEARDLRPTEWSKRLIFKCIKKYKKILHKFLNKKF